MTFDAQARKAYDVAVAAAEAAAALQRASVGTDLDIDRKSTVNDLVTRVDKESETLIRKTIADVFPDDTILGEEYGSEGTGAARWIVDPIDGTLNFAQGLPFWSVSIAREVNGELQVGVVLDVPRGDLYTAVRGGGAYRNGRPIGVSDTEVAIDAIVATGFSYDVSEKVRNIKQLEQMAPKLRGIRRFGSAALDLCYVACGQLDGYWELTLNAWDVAAGALIVQEAGGMVSELDGSPMRLDTGAYLASNGRLHSELVGLLKSL